MSDTDAPADTPQGIAAPLDPFGPSRASGGYLGDFAGEAIPVLTTWRGLREAARDWQRFSNDAPGRVPIPAEDDIRSLRQLPIETDPPIHTAYKDLVKAWFRRPVEHGPTRERIAALVDRILGAASDGGAVSVLERIALPLQSHALAALLALPEAEAESWIAWGPHAFRAAGKNDPARANALLQMLERHVDRAMATGGDDFFAHMAAARLDGRALTREEMLGYAHVTFAGGRDTMINTIAATLAHLAVSPDDHARLRAEPGLIPRAVEEIVRHTSPLTHIGRICTGAASVVETPRSRGQRIALCFAAASHDPEVFPDAGRLKIDRSPNPHVSFGAGDHSCLGSTHARQVLREVLGWAVTRLDRVEAIDIRPGARSIGGLVRRHGHEALVLALHPRT